MRYTFFTLVLVLFSSTFSVADTPLPDRVSLSACGASCLFALHHCMGDSSVSLERIVHDCKTDWRKGTNLLSIKNYLLKNKFEVNAELIELGELRNSDIYYLLPVRLQEAKQYNHYILILKVLNKVITYYDGKTSIETMTLDQLQTIWDGESLIIKKQIKKSELQDTQLGFVYVPGNPSFYVSQHEITSEQYRKFSLDIINGTYLHERCAEFNCRKNHLCRDEVVGFKDSNSACSNISWFDAYAFSKWLGPEYQLPTREQYRQIARSQKKLAGKQETANNNRNNSHLKKNMNINSQKKVCGLFSGVKEFTLDFHCESDKLVKRERYDIYVLGSINNDESISYKLFSKKDYSHNIGFRVVKTR